jgi:parallel beta-helix repeat protein
MGSGSGSSSPDGGTGPCVGTAITPAMNVQTAINNAASGTTFCFAPGTYDVSSLAPKSGDIFDGDNRQAILDGQNAHAYAFNSSSTSNVTVRGFVIQNFATPLQEGAINSFGTTGWVISNNHITHNAAAGVATDNGAQVLNNLIDWNGQEGYACHGSDIVYDGNEIAYNNHNLAVDATWEAGGGKAWATSHATFKNNYVHDNGGPGMWSDTNNIYTVYDHNTVNNNWGPGIYHEISYNAQITNNTLQDNGMPSSPGGGQKLGWLFDAAIQLRLSQSLDPTTPLLISGNTLVNNYNSIALIQSPVSGCTNTSLNEGAYGACTVKNVLVQNNNVTLSQGATGAVEDGAGPGVFTSQNNQFVNNTYSTAASHPNDGYTYGWFAWKDSWGGWSFWQGSGNDVTGHYSTF